MEEGEEKGGGAAVAAMQRKRREEGGGYVYVSRVSISYPQVCVLDLS